MSMLHILAACPHCMSMLQVITACPCCLAKVDVNAACTSCMYKLHPAACPCWMPMQHVHAECACCISRRHCPSNMYMYMLHVNSACHAACLWNVNLHVYAACPCWMSLMNVQILQALERKKQNNRPHGTKFHGVAAGGCWLPLPVEAPLLTGSKTTFHISPNLSTWDSPLINTA